MSARLPASAHHGQTWRIHEIAPDFELEDVWAVRVSGRLDEFPRLVSAVAGGDPSQSDSRAARALWALRWKLGQLLGWDEPGGGIGSRVRSLRERLPEDLRDGRSGPVFAAAPFEPLYLLEDEWAAELANHTVHGVLHLGWTPDGAGFYRGQLAVLVKPNGWFGRAYLAAIRPFRHLVIYPALLSRLERGWARGAAQGGSPRRSIERR